MPTVSFKVAGSDLISYFDRMKMKGSELSNGFIENAKKEADSAREQLRLIKEQQAALERRNRTASFNAQLGAKSGYEDRLANIAQRDALLERLHARNQEKFDSGKIGEREYITAQNRIDSLINKNSESSILSDYKDYIKKQKDSFNEQRIQTRLSRENIEAIKQTAKENVNAVKSGDAKISDILENAKSPEDKLAAKIAQEELENEKKKKGGSELANLLSAAALTGTAVKLINSFGQFSSTQNGFDLIQPTRGLQGAGIGGLIGAILGGTLASVIPGIGTAAGIAGGAAAGSAIGEALGQAEGGLEQRMALAKQDFLAARNKYIATSGVSRNFQTEGLQDVGLSQTDYLNLLRDAARQSGYSSGADKYAQDAFYAQKGYGVDQSTSMGLIELQRSAKENNRDLEKLVNGIMQKGANNLFAGGDRTFLNEFLIKFTQLQKDLLRTQNTVPSGTTFDILSRFDSMGGQFAARDPRSLGLIEQINNSLVNPGTDNLKAASFLALRRSNPNLDYFDLLKEQQKGLGSTSFMKSMMELVLSMGGNADMQKMNIARTFGLQNNLAAAETLYNNRNKILNGAFTSEDLERLTGGGFRQAARENTTPIESNAAKISDGLLKTWDEAVNVMSDSFKEAMFNAVNGIVIQLNNNGKYEVVNQGILKNNTKTPTKVQMKNGLNADNTPNLGNPMNRVF